MKLRLELKPIMEQRIELRLVQHLQGDLEDKWLTGNPRDLETLLNTQPPMSKRGNVNYILGGGWASEILTGNVRDHHDLDVVKLDDGYLLNYRIDEQTSDNYFGTFSLEPGELLKHFVDIVKWNPKKTRPRMQDKTYTLPVLSAEFLLLSKACGFLRAPRDKDIFDIEALASKIDDYKTAKNKWQLLLKRIPGMHDDFEQNTALLRDLGATETTADEMAANYLVGIVRTFKEGNVTLAQRQISDFHKALIEIYEQGLSQTTKINVRDALIHGAQKAGKLDGFWIGNKSLPEFRVFPGQDPIKKSLETIARAEEHYGKKATVDWDSNLSQIGFGRKTSLINPDIGTWSNPYVIRNKVNDGKYILIHQDKDTVFLDKTFKEVARVEGIHYTLEDAFYNLSLQYTNSDNHVNRRKSLARLRKSARLANAPLSEIYEKLLLETTFESAEMFGDAVRFEDRQPILSRVVGRLQSKIERKMAEQDSFQTNHRRLELVKKMIHLSTKLEDRSRLSRGYDAPALSFMMLYGGELPQRIERIENYMALSGMNEKEKNKAFARFYALALPIFETGIEQLRDKVEEDQRNEIESALAKESLDHLIAVRRTDHPFFGSSEYDEIDLKRIEILEKLKEFGVAIPQTTIPARIYTGLIQGEIGFGSREKRMTASRTAKTFEVADRVVKLLGAENETSRLDYYNLYKYALAGGFSGLADQLRQRRDYDSSTDTEIFLENPSAYHQAKSLRLLKLEQTPEVKQAGLKLLENSIVGENSNSLNTRAISRVFGFGKEDIWHIVSTHLVSIVDKENFKGLDYRTSVLVDRGLVDETIMRNFLYEQLQRLEAKGDYKACAYMSKQCFRDDETMTRSYAKRAFEEQDLHPVPRGAMKRMCEGEDLKSSPKYQRQQKTDLQEY